MYGHYFIKPSVGSMPESLSGVFTDLDDAKSQLDMYLKQLGKIREVVDNATGDSD